MPREIFAACTLLLSAFLTLPAAGDPVTDFYHGKSVILMVGSEAAGISDIDGRLLARYLGKYMPGRPSVVVQNMPGAGGLALANHLYNVAPKDGLVIGTFGRAVAQLAILGDPNARFDAAKFTWLGSTSSYANDAYLLAVNAGHSAQTVADLKRPGISAKIGTLSTGATNQIFADIAKDVLHLNIEVIRGYAGGPSIFLAQRSGEIDGQMVGLSTLQSAQKQLWESGGVRPLVQFGRKTRLADLADVPIGHELTGNADDAALLDFAELPFYMAQPFTAPPAILPERAASLRQAIDAAHQDAGFLDEAKKLGLDVSPIDGEAITQLLIRSAATPKPVLERYNALIKAK
jgi:tripartite-type tricarboxylate transporter receptor subunit TctC